MKLPPLPHHPEPQIMRWTALEEAAIRKAQADAARAALEEAAKVCDDEEARLWRAYRGRGKPSEKGNPYTEGASDQCAVLADAIRAIEVKHD